MKPATVEPVHRPRNPQSGTAFAVAVLMAALWAAGAGWLASLFALGASTVWVSLALLPLLLLLEIYLQLVRDLCSGFNRSLRVVSTVAVLGGFYGAWFYFAFAAA